MKNILLLATVLFFTIACKKEKLCSSDCYVIFYYPNSNKTTVEYDICEQYELIKRSNTDLIGTPIEKIDFVCP